MVRQRESMKAKLLLRVTSEQNAQCKLHSERVFDAV